jgi:protein-tyrosine kinase
MSKVQDAIHKIQLQRGTATSSDVSPERSSRWPERAHPRVENVRVDSSLDRIRTITPDWETCRQNRLMVNSDDQSAISAYKMFRTRVLRRLKQYNWTSIAVTSSRAGEGKTITAINLAVSLATQGEKNVFLVDLDLKSCSIAQRMGLEGGSNLLAAVRGEMSLEEALVYPDVDGLYLLANDEKVSNSSELLTSTDFLEVVGNLNALTSDATIIYDLPPLLSADDFLAFSPYVDCVLFVVTQGQTRREDFRNAGQILQESEVLGIVLNKATNVVEGYY